MLTRNAVLLVLLTFILTSAARAEAPLKNTTILIIRHAEKPESGSYLSPEGEKRAAAYVSYFAKLRLGETPIKLNALFATKESKHSYRPIETIMPLSKALGLPIQAEFADEEFGRLAQKIRSGGYDGKNILICWHHGKIPELLQAFGADPGKLLPEGKWKGDVFGWLVELHYDQEGHLDAKVINENLLPDDTYQPPA